MFYFLHYLDFGCLLVSPGASLHPVPDLSPVKPASISCAMVEEMLLSLSLSACLCLGLPSVIWTLYSLRKYQDAGGTITAFTVAFIGSDVLELVISPFVGTMLLEGYDCNPHLPCWVLYSGLSISRICGLQLHQLVALEGILALVYPQHSVSFFWSSMLSVTVWIFVMISHFFSIGYTINLIFCAVPVTLAIVVNGFIIRLSLLCYGSVRHRHPGLPVVAVSLLILAVVYMPILILI